MSSGFRVVRVQGSSGFRVLGLGFRVEVLGCRVQKKNLAY